MSVSVEGANGDGFVSKWGDTRNTRNCYFDLGNDIYIMGVTWVPYFKATACNGMQRNMNDSTLHRHSGTEL